MHQEGDVIDIQGPAEGKLPPAGAGRLIDPAEAGISKLLTAGMTFVFPAALWKQKSSCTRQELFDVPESDYLLLGGRGQALALLDGLDDLLELGRNGRFVGHKFHPVWVDLRPVLFPFFFQPFRKHPVFALFVG